MLAKIAWGIARFDFCDATKRQLKIVLFAHGRRKKYEWIRDVMRPKILDFCEIVCDATIAPTMN